MTHNLLRNTLITFRVFISADLGVLTLALLHKLLEDRIVVLSDGLGCHLHGAATAVRLDTLFDFHNSRLEQLNAEGLVETLAGQDVERRSHQSDLDLVLGGVVGLSGTEGILDGIDSIVAEAGNLDIGTDLGRMGGQLAADVLLQLALDGIAREGDLIPDVGVPENNCQRNLIISRDKKNENLRNGDLESIVRMSVFLVQRPPDVLV